MIKLNLKTKIILNVVILHALLMLLITYEFYNSQKEFIYREAEKNAISVAKNLAANSILWLLSNDITAMNELVESQRLNSDIHEALILDNSNKIKAALEKSLIGIVPNDNISVELIKYSKDKTHVIQHGDFIDVMSPVFANNIKIGSVRVLMGKVAVQEESRRLLEKSVLFSTIAILIGGLLAYLTIHEAMRRLLNLVNSSKEISKGNLDVVMPKKGNNDEIDNLSDSITAMVDSLKKSIKELQDLSLTLNEKVKEEIDKQREQEILLISQSRAASMGEMVIAITHHWRQPLNKIALVIQVLEDDFKNGQLDNKSLTQYVTDIMTFVRQMSDTLQGFQNFFTKSHHDSGREYDIKFIAKDTLSLLKEEITIIKPLKMSIVCKVHNLHFDYESNIISCNEFKVNRNIQFLEQIFLNLIKNSVDSIIDSNKEYGEITIEFDKDGDTITFTVRDNGIGINEDSIDKVFDPFYTTKDTSIHAGLGLYIVMMIVKKHLKGSIKAHNLPEGGCEFVVKIHALTVYEPETDIIY